MAMNTRRNPLAALLDYANNRGDEAASIGSVMSQLASPILKAQGVQPEAAVQRGPVPQPTLVNTTPAAPAAPAAPVKPLPKTTSDTEEYYIREYQKRGLSRPVAEGIVASMNAESGLNPAINERSPVVPGSRGGFGLAQWTGPRRVAFERWASDNGKNINDEQAQIDFTMAEFAGPERAAYDALIQSPDAQSAAATFTNQFLRPGVPNMEARVNDAARMSGQPYNPSIASSAGPMAAGVGIGGPMPQTVEGILSTLYPDATGSEKVAHRKDILMGLSQGLSALSQGRPVDLSNIAANADQRRRQNVVDMRERERARAGAALIYSQTGDSDMAAAVAAGTMSINDVFSERERKRIAEQADSQRLKAEQANKALGGLVLGMSKDFGWDEARTAEIATALDAGVDPSSVLTLGQQAKVAEEARSKEDKALAAAEQRAVVAEEYATSEDPVLRLTGQLLLSDPEMTVADGFKLASDRFPASAEGASGYTLNPGETRFGPNNEVVASLPAAAPTGAELTSAQREAQQLFDAKAVNPDTQKPFASPGEALIWRLGSGGTKTSVEVNTGSTGQVVPSAWVEAEKNLAENGQMFARTTNSETGQLDIVLNPDGTPKIINIEGGEAATAASANEVAAQAEAEKAALRAVQAHQSADTILRYGKDVLDMTADWKTGTGQGVVTTIAGYIPQSITSEVQNRVDTIKNMTALDNLTAMRQASPTGGALGNVSDTEGKRLEGKFGALAVTGDPAILREDTRAAMNAYLDTVHGTPEQILKLYKDGKISAEDADAFSARYVIRGAGVDPEQARIGTTENLGLSGVRTTVLGDLTDRDIAPTAIKELGDNFSKIIQDDTFFDEGGAFDRLSPTAQAEVKRLMGVK